MNEQLNFNLFLEKLDFQKQSIKTLHKLFDKIDWKSITESQWETLFDKVKTQKEKELEIHENDIKQFDKFLIKKTNKIEKENLLLQKNSLISFNKKIINQKYQEIEKELQDIYFIKRYQREQPLNFDDLLEEAKNIINQIVKFTI